MSTTTPSLSNDALQLAAHGLMVLPCFGILEPGVCECHLNHECPSAGKHPRIQEWPDKASNDEEQIARWWKIWPHSNVGIQLGPRSKIVDIEFDDEEGRVTAEELIGDIVTPTFKSNRSVHRLFKYDERLPCPPQASWKWRGLEFRIGANAKGAQTIFPPSMHASGERYCWQPGLSIDDVEFATIPPALMDAALREHGAGAAGSNGKPKGVAFLDEVWDGVAEGDRDNTLTSLCGQLLRDSGDPLSEFTQAFVRKYLHDWNQRCKPPLPAKDINALVMRITKAEMVRRENEESCVLIPPAPAPADEPEPESAPEPSGTLAGLTDQAGGVKPSAIRRTAEGMTDPAARQALLREFLRYALLLPDLIAIRADGRKTKAAWIFERAEHPDFRIPASKVNKQQFVRDMIWAQTDGLTLPNRTKAWPDVTRCMALFCTENLDSDNEETAMLANVLAFANDRSECEDDERRARGDKSDDEIAVALIRRMKRSPDCSIRTGGEVWIDSTQFKMFLANYRATKLSREGVCEALREAGLESKQIHRQHTQDGTTIRGSKWYWIGNIAALEQQAGE